MSPSKRHRRHFRVRTKIRQKRQKLAGNAFKWAGVGAAACVVLFLAARKSYEMIAASDAFRIRTIEVTGLETIKEGRFIECLPEKHNNSLPLSYFVNYSGTIKRYFPQIRKVSVKRMLPGTLKFRVQERKPIAFMKKDGISCGIDSENCVFPLTYFTDSLPELTAEPPDRKTGVKFIGSVLESNSKIYGRFSGISISRTGNVSVLFRNGTKIIWGRFIPSEIRDKLKMLNDVLYDSSSRFNAVECIDLRLTDENRITVRPAETGG